VNIQNPYTNRKAILYETDFYGREKELRTVYTRLLGGTSVSLIGERRTGKSSLMNALNFRVERESFGIPENVRIACADCQEMAGCDEETFLAYLSEQFSMAMELDQPPDPSRAAFKALGRLARSKGFRAVLAIDEFEVLVENPRVRTEFLAYLRSWSTTTEIPIIIASREGTVEQLTEERGTGSAFLNVFAPVYVGPIEPEDANDLITIPANSIGEPFDDQDLKWIRAMAGLHPFFLQIACCHLLEARRAVNNEKAHAVSEKNFIYEARPNMKYLAGRLTSQEQTALAGWLMTGSIKEGETFDLLLRKGVIVCDPEPRLFSKMFRDFVSQTAISEVNYGHSRARTI
jgi:hypothetical protein